MDGDTFGREAKAVCNVGQRHLEHEGYTHTLGNFEKSALGTSESWAAGCRNAGDVYLEVERS